MIANGGWIGADPGGRGRFGLAMLDASGHLSTSLVDCASEAVAAIQEAGIRPLGAGVDAPLWWTSDGSSRRADAWLRRTYKLSGGQVQAANSLRGAALVQGALFVECLRREFGEVPVTETHPKALLRAVAPPARVDVFMARYGIVGLFGSEHERDAAISAVAAREGVERRWRRDLSIEPARGDGEQDPKTHWLSPVSYYWPD